MRTALQDLRYGLRMLRQKPGFTMVAVIALAIGIGANTAIFSAVNAILLRPLPYDAPDRLVYIWDSNPSIGFPRFSSSALNFSDWRRQSKSFEYLCALLSWNLNMTGRGEPERLQGARASADIFPMLGVKPLLGRTFLPEEDQAGKNRVVLLSEVLWQRRFGADRNVIGQAITLNGESYTIIGIIPPEFRVPNQSELWIPAALDELQLRRGNHLLGVMARLKPDVTIEQAQTEMSGIARNLELQYPDTNKGWGVRIVPLSEAVIGDTIKPALWVLLAAVGFLLLIASANVANLLLARAATRQREIAIRTALGASRWRVFRQLLTESILLALVGGVLGLLIGVWGIDLLTSLNPDRIPRVEEIGIDRQVLGFTLLVSVLTGIIFGLAPALQGSKPDLNESLKEGGKGTVTSRRGNRMRSLLVVSEIALSLVLLVGAGLMVRSFARLQQVRLGFNPENLLTMAISLPQAKYSEANQREAFYRSLLERVATLPGVQSTAVIDPLPLAGDTVWEFFIEGRPLGPSNQGYNTNFRRCSPDYFRTMGMTLLKGRHFTEQDTPQSEQVAIINETMARQFFSNEDPLGKRISFSGLEGPWHTIVGVVVDVRHAALNAEVGLELYRPFAQSPNMTTSLVVRSALDANSIAGAIRKEVQNLDPDQPVYSVRPMEQIIANTIAPQRTNTLLLGVFAVIALLMAAVGIYSVMAYTVTQRTHEIGVRMALGARRGDVLRLVVKQGLVLAVAGVGIGLTASFTLTRMMKSLLFGVSAGDPVTFGLIALLLIFVALLACIVPARRAAKVDPIVALRYE